MASCTHTLDGDRSCRILDRFEKQTAHCICCKLCEIDHLYLCLFPNCKFVGCGPSKRNHFQNHFNSTFHAFRFSLKSHIIYCSQCKKTVDATEHEAVAIINEKFPVLSHSAIHSNPPSPNTLTYKNNGILPSGISSVVTTQPAQQSSNSKTQIKPIYSTDATESKFPEKKLKDTTQNHFKPIFHLSKDAVGLCGLRNIGNTCYLNSAIQCLYSLEPIRRCMNTEFLKINGGTESLSYSLCELFNQMSTSSIFRPEDFKKVFGKKFPAFADYAQEDSQEMIRLTLDRIHEETKHKHSDHQWKSIISDAFEGKTKNSVICSGCGAVSLTTSTFYEVSLSIPSQDTLLNIRSSGKELQKSIQEYNSRTNGVTLYDCLTSHCLPEMLDSDNNTDAVNVHCLLLERRKSLSLAYRKFHYNLTGTSKQTTAVSYPFHLDFSGFIDEKGSLYSKYKLCAMINHSGTVNYGHYISYVHRDGQWFEFNDDIVTQVPIEKVKEQEAYVLFYTRRKTEKQKLFMKKLAAYVDQKMVSFPVYDEKCFVLVYRLWWKQYLSSSEAGSPDNCSLLCGHGRIHPRNINNLANMVQPIPVEVWNKIVSQYPNAIGITNTNECETCREYFIRLDRRREEEYEIVRSLDRKVLHFGEKWNIICARWLQNLVCFLRGYSDNIQPPIANKHLIDTKTGQLRSNLSDSQYKPIAPPVWEYLVSIYGGGPAITKR